MVNFEYNKKITNISMNVAFMSLFIIIFFFSYAANIERSIVTNEVSRLTDNVTIYLNVLPPDAKNVLKNELDRYIILVANDESMKKQDDETQNKNRQLIFKSLIIYVPITILFLFISYYSWRRSKEFSFLH